MHFMGSNLERWLVVSAHCSLIHLRTTREVMVKENIHSFNFLQQSIINFLDHQSCLSCFHQTIALQTEASQQIAEQQQCESKTKMVIHVHTS